MKIALICEWLVTYAGAERVIQQMLQCFPQADVFAVVDFVAPGDRHFLLNKPVTTTFIQKLPFAKKRYRNYLPLMPKAIERLDVSGYDVILSSSHAVAKGVLTHPGQTHISYVHSPMRYAWDLQQQYLREANLDKGLKGYVAKMLLQRLKAWDLKTAPRVDHFIANSNFIAKRIWNNYQREAKVIYPGIDLNMFKYSPVKDDFYLTASRLVSYKKIDLIVESFGEMPDKKLVVIGDGPEMKKIKAKAKSNVSLLGYQDNDTLANYMRSAKAFVFAAEEDFGLVPLEAQACGTPVIAYGKGGALETVKDLSDEKPTGLFFTEQSVGSLVAAVEKFKTDGDRILPENCLENARNFSIESFRKNFSEFVGEKLKN